ncbi:uncharacterized protein I303_107950 [Kwoniella dejecticola CBS 10117]|uniref:Uncharacterized protein n=1 Tax=Kwoniella dejecticola CBS 10117 TaxID=1296121 RepID=A0A1A5ZW53_9TREE|nr:uncharacterized protein I303_07943 [Kwoniella dejecticola CBS 10117]OBR82029.1 hypothetical protein I303_07943 [Kwoniella dejecticola CBS 10117]
MRFSITFSLLALIATGLAAPVPQTDAYPVTTTLGGDPWTIRSSGYHAQAPSSSSVIAASAKRQVNNANSDLNSAAPIVSGGAAPSALGSSGVNGNINGPVGSGGSGSGPGAITATGPPIPIGSGSTSPGANRPGAVQNNNNNNLSGGGSPINGAASTGTGPGAIGFVGKGVAANGPPGGVSGSVPPSGAPFGGATGTGPPADSPLATGATGAPPIDAPVGNAVASGGPVGSAIVTSP